MSLGKQLDRAVRIERIATWRWHVYVERNSAYELAALLEAAEALA